MPQYKVLYYYQTKPCSNEIFALSTGEVEENLKKYLSDVRPRWNLDEIKVHKIHEIIEVAKSDIKNGSTVFDFLKDITSGKVK